MFQKSTFLLVTARLYVARAEVDHWHGRSWGAERAEDGDLEDDKDSFVCKYWILLVQQQYVCTLGLVVHLCVGILFLRACASTYWYTVIS